MDGSLDGISEGVLEGLLDGSLEGTSEGIPEGSLDGSLEGTSEGIPEIALLLLDALDALDDVRCLLSFFLSRLESFFLRMVDLFGCSELKTSATRMDAPNRSTNAVRDKCMFWLYCTESTMS